MAEGGFRPEGSADGGGRGGATPRPAPTADVGPPASESPQAAAAWSPEMRVELLRRLAAAPGRLALLVGRATAQQLDHADGGWSAREILAHLADLEFNLHYTAAVARFLCEDEPVLCASEPDWRALEHRYAHQDAGVALGAFTLARKHLVSVLSALDAPAWLRCGIDPEAGPRRLYELAWGFVRHDWRHMDRMERLIRDAGEPPTPAPRAGS